jgi:hypothetical protein
MTQIDADIQKEKHLRDLRGSISSSSVRQGQMAGTAQASGCIQHPASAIQYRESSIEHRLSTAVKPLQTGHLRRK